MPEVAERSTVEILRAARERITPLEAWTRGTYARNRDCVRIASNSPQARQFCSIGAIYAEVGANADDLDHLRAEDFLLAACERLGFPSIAGFNDDNPDGHEGVLAMFDLAIHLAEQEMA